MIPAQVCPAQWTENGWEEMVAIIRLPIGGLESGLPASASAHKDCCSLHGLVVGQAGLLSLEAFREGQIVLLHFLGLGACGDMLRP